jgi:hypothetical protein
VSPADSPDAFGGVAGFVRTLTARADAATARTPSQQWLHLVRRASYGPTPALLRADPARRGDWLRRQLAPASIDDTGCDRLVARFTGLGWSIPRVRRELDVGSWEVMIRLVSATVARAVWSRRQLFEVMVELWSNHFNVTCPSSDVWDCRAHYDRHAIRRHALGRFSDLLVAVTLHPAMLRYLNNASSSKEHPNENHGRELLELHTIGIDGGYTEDDVWQSARILTGLSVDDETGVFRYRPDWHETGPVRVLGFEHPNGASDGGRDVAVTYLRWLATRPQTAQTIARRLAVRFVSDAPPQALVDRLASTYLAGGTAIAPVLWQLFGSQEFAASAGAKTRRPFEDLAATLRILGTGPDRKGTEGITALGWMLDGMGQMPLAWPLPDGYPDTAAEWQSAGGTLARWNAHLTVAAGWWPNTLRRRELDTLVPVPRPATHGALVDALARRLVQRNLPAAHRDAICSFLGVSASTPLASSSAAVGWRLREVVALILDSPHHGVR